MKKTLSFFITFSLITGVVLTACTGVPGLKGTSWRLTELNGTQVPADVEITLIFSPDGVGGRAACNSYGGSFKQSGSRLSFSEMFQTEMWCKGLMDYESTYLAALGTINSFKMEGDVLSLLDASGKAVLAFSRQ